MPVKTKQMPFSRSTRLCGALVLLVLALMAASCGGKKSTASNVPPAPDIYEKTAPSKTKAAAKPKVESDWPDEDTGPFASVPGIHVDPHSKVIWSEVGYASWYGPNYHNKKGANGEIYNQNDMTAAHNTLPMNSIVRVVNLKNQVRVEVLEAPHPIETGGRWCVQMGAFQTQTAAIQMKEHLQHRYRDAQVLQFKGPTGYWVRIRVPQDDKDKTREVFESTSVDEGGVFMVRLD